MPNKDYEDYEMDEFIGCKKIKAEPAPAPEDTGEYEKGAPGYQVVYPDGYVSWSPKEVFEDAYRNTNELTYKDAVEMLELGL